MRRLTGLSSLLVLVAVWLSQGCSPLERLGPDGLIGTFRYVLAPPNQDAEVTPELLERVPYSLMAARIGDGPQGILYLAYAQGKERHWYSGDGVVLVTRHGRIVKLLNYPQRVLSTDSRDPDPLAAVEQWDNATFAYSRDIQPGDYIAFPFRSTLQKLGDSDVTLWNRQQTLLHVRESGVTSLDGEAFESSFWLDSNTGLVWKSVQTVVPGIPPIQTELIRPYSGDL